MAEGEVPQKPTTSEVLDAWKKATDDQKPEPAKPVTDLSEYRNKKANQEGLGELTDRANPVSNKPIVANRRKFLTRAVAPLIVLATVAGGALGLNATTNNRSAEQEFSQRTVAASMLETGSKNKETMDDIVPDMFVPGETKIDLTRATFRTSPETKNTADEHNDINFSDLKEIDGQPVTGNEKTMIVINAKIVNGTTGNDAPSKWMVFATDKGLEYVNWSDQTKDSGIVISEADKTGESGFIQRDINGYHGEIPKLNQKPINVNSSEMNQVSFSTTPLPQLSK